jgi:hypothetical protein
MTAVPSNREAVRKIWESGRPRYDGVTDAATAGRVLTELVHAILDFLAYRRLEWSPARIQLVTSDRDSYLRFTAGNDRSADVAVLLSQALSGHAADGIVIGGFLGAAPPWVSLRLLVLASVDGASVQRLDLDPEGPCMVSWYGPFNAAQFSEIALGFALFLTHLVATVFDDDDGTDTFEESFAWVL